MTTSTRRHRSCARIPRNSEIVYTIKVEMDDLDVRGNALASGDDEQDRAAEEEILERLGAGDVWAWAYVEVRASWRGFVGRAGLGGCNYADEEDFCRGPYFTDLQDEARRNLLDAIAAAHAATCKRAA